MDKAVGVTTSVLEDFLRSATIRGERAIALLRAVVIFLLLVRRVWLSYPELLAGDPKVWLIVGGLLAAALAAGVSYYLLVRQRLQPALTVSVVTDASLVFLTILPRSLWAPEFTFGILNDFSTAGFLVMAAAAGIRLTPLVVKLGIAANAGAFSLLLLIEQLRWGGGLDYFAGQYTMAFILFLGAAVIGWTITQRTRQLVFDGAQATLMAEKARQRLGVYVSEEIAAMAMGDQDILPGDGTRLKVAVLFSDLRGFTEYSEHLPPERLVVELNDYLDVMVAAVKEEGGVVDKYIGDSVMVVFGIPATDGREAERAIRTAQAMESALLAHNRQRAGRGLAPLKQGIGVHYGEVIAGNIGARERLQFTVVGDVVNLASRLEEATKEQGVAVLISAATVAAAGRSSAAATADLRPFGTVNIRGRDQQVETYTLNGA